MNTFLLADSKNSCAKLSTYFWAKTQEFMTDLSSNLMVATFLSASSGHLSTQSSEQQLTRLGKFLTLERNCWPIGDRVRQTCKFESTLFRNISYPMAWLIYSLFSLVSMQGTYPLLNKLLISSRKDS